MAYHRNSWIQRWRLANGFRSGWVRSLRLKCRCRGAVLTGPAIKVNVVRLHLVVTTSIPTRRHHCDPVSGKSPLIVGTAHLIARISRIRPHTLRIVWVWHRAWRTSVENDFNGEILKSLMLEIVYTPGDGLPCNHSGWVYCEFIVSLLSFFFF